MGLRIGILLGFLAGAIVKSVASTNPSAGGPIAQIKARFRQAMAEGKEAAREKEEEMRREYDETTHR